MMQRIKIFGAGSIGNHHANAARHLGWDVTVCDLDDKALNRMKNSIYPERYGKWDDSIKLFNNSVCPHGNYDLIIIGTPPDSHLKILDQVIDEKPKAILVEKPLCTPFSKDISSISGKLEENNISGFIGYDHVVSNSVEKADEIIRNEVLGIIEKIVVEFKEYWGGIFAAHPWLAGPHESYLGYVEKGGGALCEHSHALNLWQHFSDVSEVGKPIAIDSKMSFVKEKGMNYDSESILKIKTEKGLTGQVIQDVITEPTSKKALIVGSKGSLEIKFGYNGIGDMITLKSENLNRNYLFEKSRPDDFIKELEHISKYIDNPSASPIYITKGIETMELIGKAFRDKID